MGEWKEKTIKELCNRVSSGGTPSRKNKLYYEEGIYNWVKTQELRDCNIYGTEEKITEEATLNSAAKLYPINTVSMAMYGATVGKLGILKVESTTNQACCNMVADSQKLDYNFLYYNLMYNREELAGLASGAAQQNLNIGVISNFKVALPVLHEQKAIATTLSCLDNKIELNNKINKNLEEMAQAIFKSWFVDFEPFQDGEFEESELGRIPKGWKVGTLEDYVISIDNRGKTPPLATRITPYPIIDVKALSGNSRIINYNNCTKYVEGETYNNWFRNGHPEQLDILISTVGSLAEMKIFYDDKGCIAQNVVGFRSKNLSPLYLYQYLQNIKQDLVSYNIGSVQPSIKVTHIIKHKILIPSNDILNLFDASISKISNMIFKNFGENKALITIRDTLLPKLMSGEIRVPYKEVQ